MTISSKVSRRGFIGGAATGTVLLGAATTPAQAIVGKGASPALFRDDFQPIAGWRRRGVLMEKDLAWESTLLQDPCLVYAAGGGPLFKMWYGSLTTIGYATSDDGMRWTKRPLPVIVQTLASEGKALNQPSVVFRDGVYHMTYFGVGDDGEGRVHYASATKPEGPWDKGGVAIASTAPWEDRFV